MKHYYFYLTFYVLNIIFFVSIATQPYPRVSIITSVYNGDQFIEGFLKDITRQTIFDQCELIIINAASPGNEDEIIKEYAAHHSNIKYIRLDKDPGLYAVWNYAIVLSQAPLLTNSNIDDRRHPDSLRLHAHALEEDLTIDLVYAPYYVTKNPNETFENTHKKGIAIPPEFSLQQLFHICLPGPQPMWRRTLHEKYGLFNHNFVVAGDWEMWLRAAVRGSRFKKLSPIMGLYYLNPNGLSTSISLRNQLAQENALIVQLYQKKNK
jgi:glycosyltransferase involved in cell wall biosynthesis